MISNVIGSRPTVVVPLDRSDAAEHVMPIAADIARTLGANLKLLHVVIPAREQLMTDDAWIVSPEQLTHAHVRKAVYYLRQQVERLQHQGYAAEMDVEIGAPGDKIIETAKPHDVIVLSRHGYGPHKPTLGTVCDFVCNHALVPVVVCD